MATKQPFVQIIDPKHPHYPESGRFTGETISVLGQPMALVTLDHCKHGTDACYVSPRQIRQIPEPRGV